MSGYQKIVKNQPQQKNDKVNKPERPSAPIFKTDQMLEAPETLRPKDVLAAQQQVGNDVVQRSLDGTIQRDGEEFESLGGGSANQVYRVTRPGGGILRKKPAGPTGYYKPNTAEDPQMGARAVLSSDIDQTLGLNVLSKETYKTYGNQKVRSGEGKYKKKEVKDIGEGTESSEVAGRSLYEAKFENEIDKDSYDAIRGMAPAVVKEKTVGKEQKYFRQNRTDFARHDFSNPQTQKDLANINLQDAITGQHDRHGGNIKIDAATGQARGYDNDLMQPLQEIGEDSLSHIPGLHKPAVGGMSEEQKSARNAARVAALKKVDSPSDKYIGLPSHIDQASAQRLAGMKSRDFIAGIQDRDPENMARLNPEQIAELKDRYSSVRRYAKAGLAAQKPDLIADEQKRAKWSSPEYQATVRQGAGMLPKIVGEWGRESYNQQMSMSSPDVSGGFGKQNFSYLQRGVKNYNDSLAGDGGNFAENPAAGPLPTYISAPKPNYPPPQPPRALPDRSHRHAGKFNPVQPSHVRSLIEQFEGGDVHLQADGQRRDREVSDANGYLASDLNNAIQKKRGSGAALPESVQRDAKKALGRDFKDVRIHTDDESHQLSRSINARAFTIGKDIFFKHGVFAPGSSAGRETLLHELTHVIQQSGNKSSGPLKLGAPDTAHEKEADQISKKHAASGPVGALHGGAVLAQLGTSGAIQRDDDDDVSVGSEEHLDDLSKFDKEREQKTKEAYLEEQKKGPGSLAKSIERKRQKRFGEAKGKWQATLGDYKSTKEQRKSAKERLEKFHPGAMSKKDYETAETKRKSSRDEAARGGDDEAYKTMKAEEEAEKAKKEKKEAGTFKGGFKKAWKEEVSDPFKKFKKGLPGKIGGGIVKGGKSLGAGALKFATSGLTDGFKHYFGGGKSEEKGKDDDKKDEKKGKEKGEGKEEKKDEKDSGVGPLMEKYVEALKENKKLQAEIDKLKEEAD